jgi:hypothetical protein
MSTNFEQGTLISLYGGEGSTAPRMGLIPSIKYSEEAVITVITRPIEQCNLFLALTLMDLASTYQSYGGWMLTRPQEIFQEVSVDELVNYLYADDELIKEELKSLMRSYDIPEEYLGRVEAMIRDYIRSEVEKRGLPAEDWLINPLYKLFVHIAYVMLYV